MKLFKTAYMALAATACLAFAACQDDVDAPALDIPKAPLADQVNTTILDLKTEYWDDATNYIDTIRVREDGSHVIIAGRVVSSDASGNIYKNMVIQDETAAITFSINANSLYNTYRIGQEVVIDCTDMYIGKYNGLQQFGFPEWYEQGQAWEATFMPLEFFKEHAQLNGLPEPSKVDTTVVSYSDISSTTPETLRKWQSRLVEFKGAHFEDGGKLAFTDGSKITTNRTLVLADGNSIIVRTSGYSNFWSEMLPEGDGDVVGILSYYGTSGWQLLLRSRDDLIGFGEDGAADMGTFENPYSVDQVVEFEANGASARGWVTGYIVGAVAAGKTAVTSNADIEWTRDVSMPNTLVIAPTPAVTDYVSCLVVELPQGSSLRTLGNLLDNPGNYGKQIWLNGNFSKVLSTWGITGNDGSADNYKIEGVDNGGNQGGSTEPDTPDTPGTPGSDVAPAGDGTEASPYNVPRVIELGNPGTTSWVEGYIVGWVEGAAISTGAHFTVPSTVASNLLLAASKDETDVSKCIPIELKAGSAIRTAINLLDHPEMLGQKLKVEGQLVAYFRVTGVKSITSYSIVDDSGDGGNQGGSGGNDDPVNPPTPGGNTGTQDAPITVADAIALNNSGASAWVTGVIVGYVNGTTAADALFTAPAQRAGNILIAPTADVKDASQCIAVELPSKSDIRKALNLMDNPTVLGKTVTINATLKAYLGLHGLTAPAAFSLM